jgi:predicted HTH transcriptional regulator
MTNEEMEKTMQFILEQQAQFTANFQKMEETRRMDSARTTRLEESFQLLVQLAQSHDERLVALAEAQMRTNEQIAAVNERTAETDERLNALIAIVELYISRGGNGSSQA